MKTFYPFKWFAIVAIAILVLVSCRRGDDSTPTIAALPPTEAPPAGATATASPPIEGDATPTKLPLLTPTTLAQLTPTKFPPLTSTLVPDVPVPTATPKPVLEPILDADWSPQLVYSSPASGQETTLDGAITLRFDQAMDRASVEAAFAVNGNGAGEFIWTRPDTLIFTPQANFERNQNYTVYVADTARGNNGKALREAIALDFQTVGFLEVSQIIPSADSDEIDIASAITVMFNRPVVPLAGTAQQADLPNPITISPAVEGKGTWIGTSIYRFQPTILAGSTTYQVTVVEGLQDVTGGLLDVAVSAEFSTIAPKILAINPDVDIKPSDTVSITFNMPMDRGSVEGAITLEPNNSVAFNWNAAGTELGVYSASGFELNTTYRLAIGEAARAAHGDAPIADDVSNIVLFNTYPYPRVQSTRPDTNQKISGYAANFPFSLEIHFASPMNQETLQDQIGIFPLPEQLTYSFGQEQHVRVKFTLEFDTNYQITVPGSAEDIFGNQLGDDYTFQFSTDVAPPIIAFNLPRISTQFESQFPTEVVISQRNSPTVTVRLVAFDAGAPVATLFKNSNSYDASPVLSELHHVQREWQLPAQTDEGTTVLQLADGGALPTGVYHLAIDNPAQESAQGWQHQNVMLIVADTNLALKNTPDAVYIWATDLATGLPVENRQIDLYVDNDAISRSTPLATGVTDADGLLRIDLPNGDALWRKPMIAVTGVMGGNFGIATTTQKDSISTYQFDIPVAHRAELAETIYLYTERPLYRAGDTVYVRGWTRASHYARYTQTNFQTMAVEVRSAEYQAEPMLLNFPVDANGNFWGEFVIPEDAALGTWSLQAGYESDEGERYSSFTVAEFRKPDFTVSVTPEQGEALRDEMVRFTISADYLFGGSAADLAINWTAYTDPYYFPWDGSYHSFRQHPSYQLNRFAFNFGSNYVTDAKTNLDDKGQLVIELPSELFADVEAGSFTLRIEATVADESKNFITASGTMTVHSAETYVGTRPQSYINALNNPVGIELLTLDWEGNPIGNALVEVSFLQREWASHQAEPFEGEGIVWEPIDSEVAQVAVTTDALGKGLAQFTPQSKGTYLARATVTDAAGRTHTSDTFFYVSGAGGGWRFDAKDRKMELTADATSYTVGDTAHILVQSPFDRPTQAWLTIERGDVIEQRIITLAAGGGLIDLSLTHDHAPNIFVGITAIKPADDSARPWADIRLGITELQVDPAPFTFEITLNSDRDVYQPQDTVTYEISATDVNGAPVSADIALALVDVAILTLKADETPTLLDTFYAPVPFYGRLSSGLFVSGAGIAPEIPKQPPDGLGGGGGGGGFAPTSVADLDRGGDIRSDFRDTAYWQALVTTDADGKATVTVPLPDNLTTWRLTARGVSSDTLVGETTHEIIVNKPVLIRPVTPRFFTFGDTVQLGAVINNTTDVDLEALVLLEADGVTIVDPAEQTLTIPAQSGTLVRWPVFVEDVDSVDLTFRVTAGEFSDASKPTVNQGEPIPVYRYNAVDNVATAGVLSAESDRRVEAILLPNLLDNKHGELTLNLRPSLAASLFDALEAYGEEDDIMDQCAYGIALRLLPNARTLHAINSLSLDQPALKTTLDQLVTKQTAALLDSNLRSSEPWCKRLEADPIVVATVVHALATAKEAGANVPLVALQDGAADILFAARPLGLSEAASNADRRAYFLYVVSLVTEFPNLASDLDQLLADGREALSSSGLAMLQMAYANSGQEPPASIASDLANAAVLSATGTHWEGTYQFSFGSDILTTATVIEAMAQNDPDNPLLPNALRWLMGARSGSYWRSSAETAFSISAINRYMIVTNELAGSYNYTVYSNGDLVADSSFSPDTITTSEQVSIPLSDLNVSEVSFLDFQKEGSGALYYTAQLNALISADSVDAVDRGFYIERTFYDAECVEACQPLDTIPAGEEVRVELTIIVANNRRFVQIEVPLPAGADAINPDLDTSATDATAGPTSGGFNYWGWWLFDRIEFRAQKVVFISSHLPAGTYRYTFNMQTIVPGNYQVMPVLAKESLHPEVFGRSDGLIFTITP